MNAFLSTLNIFLLVLLVGLGIAIWFTASQVLSILFLVVLVIGAGNITGFWVWLASKFREND